MSALSLILMVFVHVQLDLLILQLISNALPAMFQIVVCVTLLMFVAHVSMDIVNSQIRFVFYAILKDVVNVIVLILVALVKMD